MFNTAALRSLTRAAFCCVASHLSGKPAMKREDKLIQRFEDAAARIIQAAIVDPNEMDVALWDDLFNICREVKSETAASPTLSKPLCSSLYEYYTGIADVVDGNDCCYAQMHEFSLLVSEVFDRC